MPIDTLESETAPPRHYPAAWRQLSLALAGLMVVLLYILGAQPFAAGLFPDPWDKAAHFVAYGAMASLLWIGFDGRRSWLIVLVIAAVGLFDEIHQAFLPGRSADPADLLTDVIAALCAVWTLHAWRR